MYIWELYISIRHYYKPAGRRGGGGELELSRHLRDFTRLPGQGGRLRGGEGREGGGGVNFSFIEFNVL